MKSKRELLDKLEEINCMVEFVGVAAASLLTEQAGGRSETTINGFRCIQELIEKEVKSVQNCIEAHVTFTQRPQ